MVGTCTIMYMYEAKIAIQTSVFVHNFNEKNFDKKFFIIKPNLFPFQHLWLFAPLKNR